MRYDKSDPRFSQGIFKTLTNKLARDPKFAALATMTPQDLGLSSAEAAVYQQCQAYLTGDGPPPVAVGQNDKAQLTIVFEPFNIGGIEGEHAVIQTSKTAAKIIYHFQRMPLNTADKLLTAFKTFVTNANIPGTRAEFDSSPVYTSGYDMMLFFVPRLQARDVHRALHQMTLRVLGGA